MSKNIIEKILSQPIEKLQLSNQRISNKESLRLYREIIKFTRGVDWTTYDGKPWRELIIKSARDEFELSRDERDPVLIMKMIMTSRESMHKVRDKMNDKLFQMNNNIFNSRTDETEKRKELDLYKYLKNND